MATESNKRRRTAAAADNTLHIIDLPIGILVDVASYLAKPSQVLLAVAMSAPSTSWLNNNLVHHPSATTKAILSSNSWEVLDFEGIDKRLASKQLSDDDIGAVLQCINAKDTLKRLKLAGCVTITGRCLMPLTGSSALQLLDLSLQKKYKDPDNVQEFLLSREIVMPILDSIIAVDGCSLRYIVCPSKWRVEEEDDDAFRARYHQMLRNREYSCAKCNEIMRGQWGMHHLRGYSDDEFLQNGICYDCLKPVCDICQGDHPDYLRFCAGCDKDCCTGCISVEDCAVCNYGKCVGCGIGNCSACENIVCENCMNTCGCCKIDPLQDSMTILH